MKKNTPPEPERKKFTAINTAKIIQKHQKIDVLIVVAGAMRTIGLGNLITNQLYKLYANVKFSMLTFNFFEFTQMVMIEAKMSWLSSSLKSATPK